MLKNLKEQIAEIRDSFAEEASHMESTQSLETLKIKYLGKKGAIQQLMSFLKDLSPEEKPQAGQLINELKNEVADRIQEAEQQFIQKEQEAQLKEEILDITLPGRRRFIGNTHVVTQVMDQMVDILIGMGFSVQQGPDVDSDYYNFEALNFAEDHPARDMQDTFYISEGMLLRTHTSNIQVRVMEKHRPPIRIITPGKAYRNETITARSHVFFHQVEALYIDKNVTFSDMLGAMDEYLRKLFGADVKTRYRPSYFPFVEPGLEVDVSCLSCAGAGCSLCKHTGWLEVAGAGMVHPEVLKNGGIDPEIYSGYAWGMGVERTVLLKYGINDIRLFTENDVRLLKQFISNG